VNLEICNTEFWKPALLQ